MQDSTLSTIFQYAAEQCGYTLPLSGNTIDSQRLSNIPVDVLIDVAPAYEDNMSEQQRADGALYHTNIKYRHHELLPDPFSPSDDPKMRLDIARHLLEMAMSSNNEHHEILARDVLQSVYKDMLPEGDVMQKQEKAAQYVTEDEEAIRDAVHKGASSQVEKLFKSRSGRGNAR